MTVECVQCEDSEDSEGGGGECGNDAPLRVIHHVLGPSRDSRTKAAPLLSFLLSFHIPVFGQVLICAAKQIGVAFGRRPPLELLLHNCCVSDGCHWTVRALKK